MPKLTVAMIHELLEYDPLTGLLIWRTRDRRRFTASRHWRAWNAECAGIEAGIIVQVHSVSYRYISITLRWQRFYSAQRLAWTHYHTEWPKRRIEHIDGDGLNNAIANLREVEREEITQYEMSARRKPSGIIGVNWNRKKSKWIVSIKNKGKHYFLGLFDSIDDAVATRKAAEIGHGYKKRYERD